MKSKIGILILCLVGIIALSNIASAADLSSLITLSEVKVDGTTVTTTQTNRLDIERDQDFEVRIEMSSIADLKDVEIEAFISGYEYNDRERISDATHVFDVEANVTYVKKLSLRLPPRVEEDNYKLRVMVSDRNGNELVRNYNLKIDVPRHSLMIKDVVFSPEGYVQAGRALLTTVRVANKGERDEEGIRIKASIPKLGVSASDYVDEIQKEGDDDDEVTSEELYVRIPDCAKPGAYDVEIEVQYDEGFETAIKKTTIEVLKDEKCGVAEAGTATGTGTTETPQTIINVGSVSQDVTAGVGGATYPITITNAGTSSRTYTVAVDGASSWASTTITPTNTIVLGKGETQTLYVYVSAASGTQAGQRMFSATISSADKVLKQIPLTANVISGSAAGGVKKALEIGLIILVVLLVILGLIIGFNKLRGSEEKSEEQTYY